MRRVIVLKWIIGHLELLCKKLILFFNQFLFRYTLLAGYAPFYHRQQLKMMRMIQEGRYEFNSQQWFSITDAAKNLVIL